MCVFVLLGLFQYLFLCQITITKLFFSFFVSLRISKADFSTFLNLKNQDSGVLEGQWFRFSYYILTLSLESMLWMRKL